MRRGQRTRRKPTVAGATALRSAAGCAWFTGLGFGLPGVYGMWHLVRYGEVASFLGYPTYGQGLFESRLGVATTVPLLTAFATVCAGECAAGWLLWRRDRAGGVLALVLLPLETVFWLGFSLPLGPLLGALRTAGLIISWSALRRRLITAAALR